MAANVSYCCDNCKQELPVYERTNTYVSIGGIEISGRLTAHIREKTTSATESSFQAQLDLTRGYGVDIPANEVPRFCSVMCLETMLMRWVRGISERLSGKEIQLQPMAKKVKK